MQKLTLQELFGVNAFQTVDELIIRKSDLSSVGLTATPNNRAEQLVVAILLKALENFTGILITENGIPVCDENGTSITYDQGDRLYEFLQIFMWNSYIETRTPNVLVLRRAIMIYKFEFYEPE